VLGKILVADGTQGVKVNDPIAILVDEGEAVPAGVAAPATKAAAAPQPPAPGDRTGGPVPQPAPAQGGTGGGRSAPAGGETAARSPAPAGGENAAGAPALQQAAQAARGGNGHDAGGERIFVSPLARRMAQQAGIELSALKGSGPNGRIVKVDIEAAMQRPAAASAPAPAAAAQPAAPGAAAPAAPIGRASAPAITAPHKLVPHTNMRKIIARRLTEAKATIPHYYVSMDIEIDALLKLMTDLNAKSPKEGPGVYGITINDLVIKAAAATLRRLPLLNASWTEDGIAQYDDVDISVAVAIPDGLITPIVRKADQKGLATISREMKDLGTRARAGTLKPEEFQGGTFSISNMGMLGVKEFSAIINPPQAAILAVSAGQKRPVVKNDTLAIATVMTCTLSVDHRVADGVGGAQWIREFKRIMEDPLSLLL
jgi:pyruvate dehydrogenase E2 component (dihydrolipoamide acetyltransferase)